MTRGPVTGPFGAKMIGFEWRANWGGEGPIFDPTFQVRVMDDWKPKTIVKEKFKNGTDGVITSTPVL